MTRKTDDSQSIIEAYCEAHTTQQSELLYRLERETYLKTLAPQMISGHLQGQFLTMLSKMVRPVIALEIGTFTGYAAICIAYGLPENARLYTIEVNEELAFISHKYFKESGLEEKIHPFLGDAADIVPRLPAPFDFVFLDAGKKDYSSHYDLVIDRVSSGGIIIADNVLWSNKVANSVPDETTRKLHDFNQKVQQDTRVENILLPVRDGLMVIRKK